MRHLPARKKDFSFLIIGVFFLFVIGLIIGGYFYYVSFRNEYFRQSEHTLLAIANLQTKEIVQWRKERLGDAVSHFQNDAFYSIYKNFLTHPKGKKSARTLDNWLDDLVQYYNYDRVTLFDTQGNELKAVPHSLVSSDSIVLAHLCDLDTSGSVSIIDLYRHKVNAHVYLTILVPIIHPHARDMIGIVAIRIDPDKNLFSMLKEFPFSSRSGETLLIRKEGNEIVFLNDMRLINQPPMTYRASLTQTDLPAVKEVLGHEGIISGFDYRGIPVLASTGKIPDSPWYIVVKINKEEVEQPITEKLWQVQLVIFGLILGTGGVVGYTIKNQRYKVLHEKMIAVQQQKFLQDIIQNSLNEVYIFNADTLIFTFANDASCRNLQYTLDEMKMLTPVDIKPDFTKESYIQLIQPLILKTVSILTFETIHRRKDHSIYPVEVHLQLAGSGDENVIVTFVNDISERKKNNEKINKTIRELERSNKELEQFAYVASHDLQEPLRMVSSYTQLLASRYKDKLDSDANDFIQFAVDGSKRMQQLINDLLDYSRVTTRGKDFETVDLNSVLGDVIVMLQQKIGEENAIITNTKLPEINADSSQITRLIQNLIDNAIKYRRKEILPVIHISCIERETEFEFLVQDNGIGIDETYKDRIFIIFQRLHSKEEYSGSGIGLAICKRIVERHQGAIWFQSIPGSGTTFHFTVAKHLANEKDIL